MRHIFLLVLFVATYATGSAAQVTSEYTRFDAKDDCSVIDRAGEGDGDWADIVCVGYANYPFVVRYGDARETVTYGFASQAGMAGFSPFNNASGTVEWRVRTENGVSRPFAAIQRWFVARPENAGVDDQVLVVSRVGQPSGGGACAIAYVRATGEPSANVVARRIADERAELFKCGAERPLIGAALRGIVVEP